MDATPHSKLIQWQGMAAHWMTRGRQAAPTRRSGSQCGPKSGVWSGVEAISLEGSASVCRRLSVGIPAQDACLCPHWAGLPVLCFLFASLATSERRQRSTAAMTSSPGSIRVRTTRARRKTGMPITVIRSQRCTADRDIAGDVHTLCWPSSHFGHTSYIALYSILGVAQTDNRSSMIDTSDVFRNTLLAEATGYGQEPEQQR